MNPSRIILGVLIVAIGVVSFFVKLDVGPDDGTGLFYQSEFLSVPEGTLIRSEVDERIYYAENGHKRWVDSLETFLAQGFQHKDIHILTASELAQYPEGEPITAFTPLVLPREQKVLPDLAPLAPYDLRLATIGGRRVIRFTGSFWNKGYRPFELLTENHVAGSSVQGGTEDVYQHIQAEDGTYRKKFVGTFVWHSAHNHHHYGEFAEYLLERTQIVPGTKLPGSSIRQKTTFCIRDNERMPADVPNAPAKAVFTECGKEKQGLSSGWIDVYSHTLSDQYIDVNDLPPGTYALSFLVDPNKRFVEERDDNNIATTIIELDARRGILRIIASMSPFLTLWNQSADGLLLRDAESGKVYVIQEGRKYWLRNVDIFTSYGYEWSAIYPATKAMVDAIPNQQLIRRVNTQEVFVLNEHGHYRHLLNPEVFYSYGFTAADIMDVNYPDFSSHERGELIMRSGDTEVYIISGATKHSIGTLSNLRADGYDLRGLHLVNQTDFDAYLTN